MRCLMYLTRDEHGKEAIYLIDRRNDYYFVPHLHFPLPDSEQAFHINTLIDGELVNDREADGSAQLRYLVFDCLLLDGNPLLLRPLDKRLAYYRDKLFNPYVELYRKYPSEKEYCPFVVEFKKMEKAYGIEMLFRDVLPKLPHGNDGLIFTCRNTPYKHGTDPHILKWKPANENSVDFRLDLDIPLCELDSEDEANGIYEAYPDHAAMPGFRLSVGMDSSRFRYWGEMYVSPQEWEDLKALQRPLDEAIVECYKDADNRWRFMRLRDDKRDPNHISTVESVMESINDRVEESHLIAAAKEIRDAWKMREHLDREREKEEATVREREAAARRNNGQQQQGLVHRGGGGVGGSGRTNREEEMTGVQYNGAIDRRDTSSAQKRKLGSVDGGVPGGEDSNKRRITPQPD